MSSLATIDCHINNFTALSVVGVWVQDFEPIPPLALCQILKSGNYLTIYMFGKRRNPTDSSRPSRSSLTDQSTFFFFIRSSAFSVKPS